MRKFSIAIYAVAVMHLFQVIMISYSRVAVNATGTTALLHSFETVGLGLYSMIFSMILASMLAIAGMLMDFDKLKPFLFLPQHFFLGIMMAGGMIAAYRGQYLDGTVIAGEHILTDQLPFAALFVIHSVAIVRAIGSPPDGLKGGGPLVG
jgi:hypothetical protein